MRIISGKHKGKRLIAPKNLPVRPTTDMAKEALFNILNNRHNFQDLHVLDLFSGTGNIAYEFASRGARPVIAVDENFNCVKYIKKTSSELELGLEIIKSDVFKYLEKAAGKADLIFADPPYNFEKEAFLKIVYLTFEQKLLNENGTLIIEHSKHTDLSDNGHFVEARKYGSSVFSFFE